MNVSLYEVTWMFFFYAFLGWCAEVAYAAVRRGKFVNRGFLNGPVCPIYGFGLVTVILLLSPLSEKLVLLFLGSVVLTSTLEFLTGWVLETLGIPPDAALRLVEQERERRIIALRDTGNA